MLVLGRTTSVRDLARNRGMANVKGFLDKAFKTGLTASPHDTAKVVREIKRGRHSPILHDILGRIYASKRQYDKACVQWRECIRRSRGKNVLGAASLRELIADTLLLLGRHREARLEYGYAARCFRRGRTERLAGIIKDDARVREAYCLAQLERWDEACRLLQHVRRGPNCAIFEEDIQELSRKFVSLGSIKTSLGRTGS